MNTSSFAEANEQLKWRNEEGVQQPRFFNYNHTSLVTNLSLTAENYAFKDHYMPPMRRRIFYLAYDLRNERYSTTVGVRRACWDHVPDADFLNWYDKTQSPGATEGFYRKGLQMDIVLAGLQQQFPLYHIELTDHGNWGFFKFEYAHPTWKVLALAVPTAATKPAAPAAKLARLDGDHCVMVRVRDMLVERG